MFKKNIEEGKIKEKFNNERFILNGLFFDASRIFKILNKINDSSAEELFKGENYSDINRTIQEFQVNSQKQLFDRKQNSVLLKNFIASFEDFMSEFGAVKDEFPGAVRRKIETNTGAMREIIERSERELKEKSLFYDKSIILEEDEATA